MSTRNLGELWAEVDNANVLNVHCRGNGEDGSILFHAAHHRQSLMRDLVAVFDGAFRKTDQTLCCTVEFDTKRLPENHAFDPNGLPEDQDYVLWAHVTSKQLFLYGPETMGELITLLANSIGLQQTEFDDATHTIWFSVDGEFTPTRNPKS